MASAPAMKRRGGCSWLAIVMSARELRGVAGLSTVMRFPILDQRPSAVLIIGDRRLGVVCRLLGEELRAKESWIDDGGVDAEGRYLGLQRLHPALESEL